MHVKREISVNNINNMSDSIKRLAISHDGHPIPQHAHANAPKGLALEIPNPDDMRPILTVMSNAKDDFMSRYDVVKQIGKGGFSTVYQCRRKGSTEDYAVKVIDLRPLRLKESFNPTRLKREVEIMRKLKHKNIIQFIEVYEDPDYLMMVLEYCQGVELFDVIINQKCLSEDYARPIFAQMASALFYLHSLNIIHRDIKPENVLISHDPVTGEPIAKLLDFGLSRPLSGGSLAKTFVGTPCYLAPEVELTSKGGGTYGLPADCWSLGAVLYVMLVARFPEFERDFSGKVVVKLPEALWSRISNEAKDLVRSLMNTNQHARIGMANVLRHPWMGKYQMSQSSIEKLHHANYYLGRGIQEEEEQFEEDQMRQQQERSKYATPLKSFGGGSTTSSTNTVEMTAAGHEVHHQAMVIRVSKSAPPGQKNGSNNNNSEEEHSSGHQQLPLAPLLQLQRDIAICFEEAHEAYLDFPEVAAQVRKGATLCREQLRISTKMLIKVEQTAEVVLGMFPDLELAIEEGEPALAGEFFNMVKTWVAELKELVHSTQTANKSSMEQIQEIVENSTSGLQSQTRKKNSVTMPKQLLLMLANLKINNNLLQIENGTIDGLMTGDGNPDDDHVELDANQILGLFVSLFGIQTSPQGSPSSAGTVTGKDRVTSIDSDISMDLERKRTASPLDISHLPHNGTASTSSAAKLEEAAARARNNSGTIDINSDTHKTRSGTIDISRIPSNGSGATQDSQATSLSGETAGSHIFTSLQQQQLSNLQKMQQQQSSTSQKLQQQASGQPMHVGTPRITYGAAAEGQQNVEQAVMTSKTPKAAAKLTEALTKLRQVDMILEQLGVFWANTEVVLDLLTKKGMHVEQFLGFASKPKLMARFKERIEEYKRFWEGVSMMASNYISGVSNHNNNGSVDSSMPSTADNSHSGSGAGSSFASNPHNMYGFLEKEQGGVGAGAGAGVGERDRASSGNTASTAGTGGSGLMGGVESAFMFPDVTPLKTAGYASTVPRFRNATPPDAAAAAAAAAASFDSLGGVFKTVHSPPPF